MDTLTMEIPVSANRLETIAKLLCDLDERGDEGYTSTEIFSLMENDLMRMFATPAEMRQALGQAGRGDLLADIQHIIPFFATEYQIQGICPDCGLEFTAHRRSVLEGTLDTSDPDRYRMDSHGEFKGYSELGHWQHMAVASDDPRCYSKCAGRGKTPTKVSANFLRLKSSITLPHSF